MTELPQPDDVEDRERSRVTATELSWAFREAQRAQDGVNRRLAHRLDLRPSDYQALSYVMTADGPLGPAELSARMAMSTGSGTELVDRLEASGHLERHRHPTDRRRLTLQPGAAAVERILGELAPLFATLDRLADDFTPGEQEAIARYLRSAASHLNRFADDG